MLGFGRTERLYEARIADLKKEHQRTVEALTAWIEQLQLQVGAPTGPVRAPAPPTPGSHPDMAMYLGEEEEALLDAHAGGLITQEQLEHGLAEIGANNVEILG